MHAQLRKASLHARARWLGVLFFLIALVLLGASVVGVVLQVGALGDIAVSLFATGTSLGVFGSHNDAALGLLRDLRGVAGVPAGLSAEIDEEYLFNRLELSDLQVNSKTAWFMTFAAPIVISWATWRLAWILA